MRSAEYYRKYYAANREHILARCRDWRKRNVEKRREIESAWRKANPEKRRKALERYRLAHRDERRAKDAEYQKRLRRENPEKVHARERRYRARKKERMSADQNLYAHYRSLKNAARKRAVAKCATEADRYAKERLYKRRCYARRMIKAGKGYSPRPQRRIPDYATKGNVADVRSQYLIENQTASQKAYARELAIERAERRKQ